MIRRLRGEFIRIAMLAVTLVLLLLTVSVNAVNDISVSRQQDRTLEMIVSHQGTIPAMPKEGKGAPRPNGHFSPETPYDTRFFVLRYTDSGDLTQSDLTHIASVTEADTEPYLQAALSHGEGSGWQSGYRFRVVRTGENRWMAVFLDCRKEVRSLYRLAGVSVAAMAVCVALVYLIVVRLSRRAMEPVVQSVQRQKQFITDAGKLTLVKTEGQTPANIEIVTGTDAVTAEVRLEDQNGNKVTAADGKFFTIALQLEKKLNVIGFYHSETPLTKAESAEAVKAANDTYYYDAATGLLTFSTDDFSPFTVVTSSSVFNGGNGTKANPYLVATGEQALKMEKAKGYFKLVDDIVVTDEIYLSGKTVTVDLNGHSIRLEYAAGVKPNNGSVFYVGGKKSSLTINDSSEGQTGAVYGSDKTYTNKVTSAVRAGNYGKLTINGGHFYGTSEGTSCIFVYTSMSSGSKATVTINGGKFETTTPSNGTYYVLNHQDNATAGCTITVNGGSFKNYNPGVTTVDPVNAKTGKITLGNGCTTTSTVDGSDTWYTVSK